MLSMRSVLKATINGKDYEYVCQPDSPLADALEAHNQFGAFLLGKQEQNKVSQAAQEAQAAAVQVEQPESEMADIRTEN